MIHRRTRQAPFVFSPLSLSLLLVLSLPTELTAQTREPLSTPVSAHPASLNTEASRQFILQQRGDPVQLQRLHRRNHPTHPTQSSGFWAQQGEWLKINYRYEGEAPSSAPELWIVPVVKGQQSSFSAQKVTLEEGDNDIKVSNSGPVYFVPTNQPGAGEIHVALLEGAEPMPRFILGQHNKADWGKMLQQYGKAPFAELVGKRMILTMPLEDMRQHATDPEGVLKLWDRIVTIAEEQYGLAPDQPLPHRSTPFQYQFVSKPDASAGYMSAADFWLGTNADGISSVVNTALLNKEWGPWHELGHHYQMPAITLPKDIEVSVNLTSMYIQRALGGESRLEKDGVWNRVAIYLNQQSRDYETQSDLFIRAAMYWQLDLAFGRDFYQRLGARIRTLPLQALPTSDAMKRHTLILETSRVSGFDLIPFFARWGIAASPETVESINALKLKKVDSAIWRNRDNNILRHYSLAEQNISGDITLPDNVSSGQVFTASVKVHNRENSLLNYEWNIPAGFKIISRNNNEISLRAPRNSLQNGLAEIAVTVSDGTSAMPLAGKIQLKTDEPNLTATQGYDNVIKKRYQAEELKQWAAPYVGSVGDIYAYDNRYTSTRDYFRLKNSKYWYFPSYQTDNRNWEYLESYDGSQYLTEKPPALPDLLASAGEDRRLIAPTNAAIPVTLDGSLSHDPAGKMLSWQWSAIGGAFTLRHPNQARAEVVIPKNAAGESHYQLTVTTPDGRSATAQTRVIAVPARATIAGSASAAAGKAVALNGQSNFEGLPNTLVSYSWTLTNGDNITVGKGSGKRWSTPVSLSAGSYTVNLQAFSQQGDYTASAQQPLTITGGNGGAGCGISAWQKKSYTGASKVTRQGRLYVSKWWAEPGQVPGDAAHTDATGNSTGWGKVWEDKGACK